MGLLLKMTFFGFLKVVATSDRWGGQHVRFLYQLPLQDTLLANLPALYLEFHKV